MNRPSIRKHIGKRHEFRVGHAIFTGIFRGIGVIENNYGMVFSQVYMGQREMPKIVNLFIDPRKTKCVAKGNFIRLRYACRRMFNTLGLQNKLSAIFFTKWSFETKSGLPELSEIGYR